MAIFSTGLRRNAFRATRGISLGLAVLAPVAALVWALKTAAFALPRYVTQQSIARLGDGRVVLPPVEPAAPNAWPIYLLVAIPFVFACAPLLARRHELRPEAEVVPAILTAGFTILGAWSIGLPFAGAAVVLVPLAVVGWIERRIGRGLD